MKHNGIVLLLIITTLIIAGGGCKSKKTKLPEAVQHSFIIDLSDSLLRHGVADTINLGRIKEGEVVLKTIGVRNLDKQPMVILDMETTCGCATVNYPKQPLKPGEIADMTFVFDSKGEIGWQLKAFRMLTSANQKRRTIFLKAEVY